MSFALEPKDLEHVCRAMYSLANAQNSRATFCQLFSDNDELQFRARVGLSQQLDAYGVTYLG